MAYYYVKNGETAGTAGGTTIQSGAFSGLASTATWGSVQSAIDDGGATSADFICVSDSSAFSSASNITWIGPSSGDFIYIVTVDDSNCENEADRPVSSQEQTTGGADIVMRGRLSLFNLHIESNDNIDIDQAGAQIIAQGCTFDIEDVWFIDNDGVSVNLKDCNVISNNDHIYVANGTTFRMCGGSITGYVTKIFNNSSGFGNGGGLVNLSGVDISDLTGTFLLNIGGNSATDDAIEITLDGCKLNATPPTWANEEFQSYNHRITATHCASSSVASEHQYYVESYGGSVEEETTIYRDNTKAWPSGQKTSLKCIATADATRAAPFWFDFPTRYLELSNTATDTPRIYLATTSTLYDTDVWVEIVYPDGTTKHEYNYLSTRHDNILDTNGTVLDTSTETWFDDSEGDDVWAGNEYQIDVPIGATDAGADSTPIIRMYVATNATIYFDDNIDIGAG